ncbi:MAG TPA: choice-of-anchor D domain-containing protein, partial [Polyangiaceae bacterium]|nr:choice-of-anchor D domain-containing protein [Polyangiaceae bacterium]
MKLEHLAIVPTTVACWLLAGSCAIDERDLKVTVPAMDDGGAPSSGQGGMGAAAGSESGGPEASLPGAIGAAPRLAVGTEAIDLGWVTAGFPARARVRVDNVGGAPLPPITVGFAPGSHPEFSLIQNGCARDVAPGASCELRVQLVPSDAGERAATLVLSSETGGDAQVALVGLGLAGGALMMAPVAGSFEDFGGARVGSTEEETFSILNPGEVASGPLRFRSSRSEFALIAPGEGDCIPEQTSLAAGESCTVRLAFTPSERGPLEATLTGASDGAGAASLTLVGRGLLPATLRASVPALDFAGVVLGSSARRNVSFENAGDEPLTSSGARLQPEGAGGFSISNSDCGEGASIEGGASCSVQLEFRPPTVGDELTAEVVAGGGEEGQAATVPLRGIGLAPGALAVSALAPGDDDFGDVLLGASSERRFQIQNPSAQPSGVLDFALSEGFALADPASAEAGECVPGSTSLVDGEVCTVRVQFAPSRRERFAGSLTVSSSLAGAAELPVQGRGIAPAVLATASELNFGRVLTGASGSRPIELENRGDEPLPPPRLELTGTSRAQVAAFSFESQCSAPLAPGEACSVNLTFAPTEPTPHAVTLSVSSSGGDASVLLLGEAQVPGSLVLEAAGGSPEFGDVPIGTSVTRTFSLSNPGPTASGRLSISSDNNRFEVELGDCNPAGSDGLAQNASCTFSVRFTPSDNLAQVASLSVQSPGAGRAGLQLSGRGRQPPLLSATGNRDLGRANVGQDALTQPQNEFTWTVSNQGDLPTSTLGVANDNGAEFAIRDDSCSGSAVPGRASCQMVIRFLPSAAGRRAARVVVSDAGASRSVTLALTGLGVQLAALGESCVNAECAAGVCTLGVCCNRACDRTCQVCSAQGQCEDQSDQEACGNGAACFGVDNCRLPAGGACSQNGGDAQCGSGNCERRLGGSGAADRICCLDDCGDTLECDSSNRCSECTTGQRRCNNGRPQQCSAGRWQDSAACPGNLACVNDGQCGCTGNTPRQCGNNLCVAQSQCCQSSDCSNPCQACDSSSHACGALNGQPDRCPGSQLCNAQLQCVDCNNGDTRCVQGTRQQCNNGSWQNAGCPGSLQCQGQGTCGCNTGTACNNQCVNTADDENNCGQCGSVCAGTCVNGTCRAGDGASCSSNIDCASGLCQAWAFDRDGDGFGLQNTQRRICGAQPPSDQPGGAGVWRRVNESVPVNQRFDCCDTDANASPSQTNFQEAARSGGCAGLAGDFNCDGREDLRFESLSGDPRTVLSGFETCADLGTNCDSGPLIWIGGEPPPCGTPRGQAGASQCFPVDGQ